MSSLTRYKKYIKLLQKDYIKVNCNKFPITSKVFSFQICLPEIIDNIKYKAISFFSIN